MDCFLRGSSLNRLLICSFAPQKLNFPAQSSDISLVQYCNVTVPVKKKRANVPFVFFDPLKQIFRGAGLPKVGGLDFSIFILSIIS